MTWGEVELEPEVDVWFDTLDQGDKETAAFYVDLLAERGVLLDDPYTRQLRGKLRELRSISDDTRCASAPGSRRIGASSC